MHTHTHTYSHSLPLDPIGSERSWVAVANVQLLGCTAPTATQPTGDPQPGTTATSCEKLNIFKISDLLNFQFMLPILIHCFCRHTSSVSLWTYIRRCRAYATPSEKHVYAHHKLNGSLFSSHRRLIHLVLSKSFFPNDHDQFAFLPFRRDE